MSLRGMILSMVFPSHRCQQAKSLAGSALYGLGCSIVSARVARRARREGTRRGDCSRCSERAGWRRRDRRFGERFAGRAARERLGERRFEKGGSDKGGSNKGGSEKGGSEKLLPAPRKEKDISEKGGPEIDGSEKDGSDKDGSDRCDEKRREETRKLGGEKSRRRRGGEADERDEEDGARRSAHLELPGSDDSGGAGATRAAKRFAARDSVRICSKHAICISRDPSPGTTAAAALMLGILLFLVYMSVTSRCQGYPLAHSGGEGPLYGVRAWASFTRGSLTRRGVTVRPCNLKGRAA